MPVSSTSAAERLPGRRERLRREAIVQIKQAALDQVRLVGAADVSLRAVARGAGMSPAGLYRYYDGRDAILTDLIADAFDRLAEAMADAASTVADPLDQMAAVARAYRRWSVTHPHEFGLVFGNPVPGYAAPVGGETSVAMARVGRTLFTPLVMLWTQGRAALPESYAASSWAEPIHGLAAEITALMAGSADGAPGANEDDAPLIPPALAGYLQGIWGRLHGVVSLEVFGQFTWLYADGAEELFEADLGALLETLR